MRNFVLSIDAFKYLYKFTKVENPLLAEYMKLLMQTGWRRGELYKLRWDDLLDEHIVLRKTKSKGQDDYYPYFSFLQFDTSSGAQGPFQEEGKQMFGHFIFVVGEGTNLISIRAQGNNLEKYGDQKVEIKITADNSFPAPLFK